MCPICIIITWGGRNKIQCSNVEIIQAPKYETESSINKYDNIIVVSHSIYIVCLLYETISTVLISDVKPPYQTMLPISIESVLPGVNPPTTMSSL